MLVGVSVGVAVAVDGEALVGVLAGTGVFVGLNPTAGVLVGAGEVEVSILVGGGVGFKVGVLAGNGVEGGVLVTGSATSVGNVPGVLVTSVFGVDVGLVGSNAGATVGVDITGCGNAGGGPGLVVGVGVAGSRAIVVKASSSAPVGVICSRAASVAA